MGIKLIVEKWSRIWNCEIQKIIRRKEVRKGNMRWTAKREQKRH